MYARHKPTTNNQQAQAPIKNTPIKFEVGIVYRVNGERWVCVDRYADSNGDSIVGFVEIKEHRENLKDEDFVPYDESRRCGFATHEELAVRVFNDVERATQCDNTDDIEDYDFRADRKCGTATLTPKEKKPRSTKKASKNAGSGCATIIAVLVVLWLIGKIFAS